MTAAVEPSPRVYGVIAEYDDPEHLVAAARAAHEAGYRKLDAYSPFPVHGLSEALDLRRTGVPSLVLVGGLVGAAAGFGLQHFTAVIDYPLNIGGRADLSWPAFIPITFEIAILCAGFAAAFGMILLNGLPRPHHPVFNADGFDRVTRDGFFLCIEAEDPIFDPESVQAFLQATDAKSVSTVEHSYDVAES